MDSHTMIVKLGGLVARDADVLRTLARDIAGRAAGLKGPLRIAIVHGGGNDVTELTRRLGMEPVFADGVRMTTPEEMDVVDMVLCGLVNKRVVRALSAAGVPAVGLSGADAGLFLGARLASDRETRTATVARVDPRIVETLWDSGYVPVIASPGTDSEGTAVNINADQAAFALGSAVSVGTIVFLSDVPGILVDGTPRKDLSLRDALRLIERGEITGGMIEKVRSIRAALDTGVGQVVVGCFKESGDLERLASGQIGTTVHGAEL
jgi:acetylglutamate kinase